MNLLWLVWRTTRIEYDEIYQAVVCAPNKEKAIGWCQNKYDVEHNGAGFDAKPVGVSLAGLEEGIVCNDIPEG